MTYNVQAEDTSPKPYNHINGTVEEITNRHCVQELCMGWPVYRDYSEWRNYRDLFADDAVVFTTWSGGLGIDEFIAVSKKGRAAGDFIMHRVNGVLANLNLPKNRAIGKMKATISQRFNDNGLEYDVDCDCRFIFFCQKVSNEVGWKAKYVKLFYERENLRPVDGKNVPTFTQEELSKYPMGYQYLGCAQAKLGHKVLGGLPNMNNKGFYAMYEAMDKWLQGEEINLFWEH